MTVEYTVSKSRDCLVHAASLAGWQQEYDQLESCPFHGQLVDIRTGSVRLFRERANCKILQLMQLPTGCRHLVLPLSWPAEMACDMAIQLLPRGQRYRVVVPGSFDVLGLSIPDEMALGLPAGEREMLCRPVNDQRAFAALKSSWARLTDEVSRDRSKWPDASIAKRLEADTIQLLELLGQEQNWRVSSVSRRQYIVERCHVFTQSRPNDPPTIEELCDHMHISRRTLQYSFTSQTGVTPTRYLRAIRLNAARRTIAARPQASVLDLAADHGFLHASHFGRVYRDLFGEKPSDTRRRASAYQGLSPHEVLNVSIEAGD